jgi:hypothetical protein
LDKANLGFAVGAIVAALALGGALYALYPNSFSGYNAGSATTTAYSPYLEQTDTSTAAVGSNSTANQNATETSTASGTGNATSGNAQQTSGY